MATPKAMKDFIQRRKDNHLCVSCGKPLDRNGVNCIDCNNKRNEEYRKTKQAYIDCGICYRCRKNPIIGSEKTCPECRAKLATWKENRPEDKIEIEKEQTRRSHERIRQECRDNGICYVCKKRKASPNRKACDICREKQNRYNREYTSRNSKKLTREQKIDIGICIWCDNPVRKGKKLCDYHCDNNIQNLENRRKPNDQWRKDNKLAFKN